MNKKPDSKQADKTGAKQKEIKDKEPTKPKGVEKATSTHNENKKGTSQPKTGKEKDQDPKQKTEKNTKTQIAVPDKLRDTKTPTIKDTKAKTTVNSNEVGTKELSRDKMSPSKEKDKNVSRNKPDNNASSTVRLKTNESDDSIESLRADDETPIKKVTIIDPKYPKAPSHLDKLKMQDIVARLKDIEEKLKIEKEEKQKMLEIKNKELEAKEKVISSVSITNRKLMSDLDTLKHDVDEKMKKIGIKQIKDIERDRESKKKALALEQMLKLKEKELKNATSLVEIIKKDKENLIKMSSETADPSKMAMLEEKIKAEQTKIQALENEVKSYSKMMDNHNRCSDLTEIYEKERGIILSELKFLKDKNKEYNARLKEEQDKIIKLNQTLLTQRKEAGNNKISIASPGSNLPNINTYKQASSTFLTDLPTIQNNSPKNISDSQKKKLMKSTAKTLVNQNSQKSLVKPEKLKFSVSLQDQNFRPNLATEASKIKLFGKREKEALKNLFPVQEIERFENKFDAVGDQKDALEKKFLDEKKQLKQRVTDLQERIEFSQAQNKENEHKNKILQFQINEHKNENKLLIKKLTELTKNYKKLDKTVKEKEEQNRLMANSVNEKLRNRVANSSAEEDNNETEQDEEDDNDLANEELVDED